MRRCEERPPQAPTAKTCGPSLEAHVSVDPYLVSILTRLIHLCLSGTTDRVEKKSVDGMLGTTDESGKEVSGPDLFSTRFGVGTDNSSQSDNSSHRWVRLPD